MSEHSPTVTRAPRHHPPAALDRSKELVAPALREAVDRLSPAMRRVAGYHLGWLDADGRPAATSGGKAVRAALALLSAEAVGGPAEVGVPGAVAVELVHNFSLLHDDLMDGDRERRHRPTAWTVFGEAQAILAGDALMTLAGQVLLEVPGEPARRAAACLSAATQELITGQVDDLAFESRLDVTVGESLDMVMGKTGALLACSAQLGAVLAGAGEAQLSALYSYGAELGIAFQLIDDLLGIWGQPEVTGKPVLADLRVRKKSAPVVVALASGGDTARRLAGLLTTPEWRGEEDIALAAKLVDEAGGREWCAAEAQRRLTAALAALDRVSLAPGPREELAELARFVTDREL